MADRSALEEAAAQRLAGDQLSRTRAFVAAAAAAVATGTLVYRASALRR